METLFGNFFDYFMQILRSMRDDPKFYINLHKGVRVLSETPKALEIYVKGLTVYRLTSNILHIYPLLLPVNYYLQLLLVLHHLNLIKNFLRIFIYHPLFTSAFYLDFFKIAQ